MSSVGHSKLTCSVANGRKEKTILGRTGQQPRASRLGWGSASCWDDGPRTLVWCYRTSVSSRLAEPRSDGPLVDRPATPLSFAASSLETVTILATYVFLDDPQFIILYPTSEMNSGHQDVTKRRRLLALVTRR